MKKIFTLSVLLISYIFAFGQVKDANTFKLSINKDVNVVVYYSKDSITTINTIKNSKTEFQVEYHFDNKQLFYIRLLYPSLKYDKTFEVKRIKRNGYGYLYKDTDYKLDYFLPREKQGDEDDVLKQFVETPNLTDNEQLSIYFDELYRQITKYFAENIGTVAFFGSTVADKKNAYLYYKFDDEKFSPSQKVEIKNNSLINRSKKIEGEYRLEFDRKQLKDHQILYFSTSLTPSKDTILRNQNSIHLVELRKMIEKSPTEKETEIFNDILLTQHFDDLTTATKETPQEEKKYIGKYKIQTRENKNIVFELRENNVYYSKIGDIEKIGLWKTGKVFDKEGIKIYNYNTINRKIGNIKKSGYIGDSLDIMITEGKLFYPISMPEVWTEINKIE